MFRKSLAVAVILLFIGVAFAIPINANVSKSSLEPVTDIEEDATPIALVFQLIAKLRNHKDIQNVETEDELLQIIEGDEELNSIYEQLSGDDCGCDEDNSALEWSFPVICILLIPLYAVSWYAYMMGGFYFPLQLMYTIGSALNCMWI